MTVFKKINVVLNLSIDGKFLYALGVDNNTTTVFELDRGISIANLSDTEVIIKEENFPIEENPFIIEIHDRWPSISYDGSRDLVFACGIGVGMDVPSRIGAPSLESSYSTGINVKTYFNYLSQHDLFIKSDPGKLIQFRSVG